MNQILDQIMEVAEENGCKHLYGNLFLVPFDLISVPDSDQEEIDDYNFKNPRMMTEVGQNTVLDKDLSAELRNSIKSRSLLNPLICRWVEDEDGNMFPQLVGGDRRYRALDYLIRKRELVFDPRTCRTENGNFIYEKAPADEVYKTVVCQVFNVNDDLDALALSWAENKGRVNLNDGHEIAVTIRLRDCGASDEKILEIIQQSEKWLAATDRLIEELDEATLQDLLDGRLDRASALELMQIEDPELRQQIREKANKASEEFADRKKKRISKKYEAALEEKELAEGALAEADFNDDEEAQEIAKEAVDEADKKAKRMASSRSEVKAVTTPRQVKQAAAEVAGDEPVRCLSGRKIRLCLDYIQTLIDNKGECPQGNFQADLSHLEFLYRVLDENILGNDDDLEATISTFFVEE